MNLPLPLLLAPVALGVLGATCAPDPQRALAYHVHCETPAGVVLVDADDALGFFAMSSGWRFRGVIYNTGVVCWETQR